MTSNPSPFGKYLKALTDLGMGLVVGACVAGIFASVAWFCELTTHFVPYLFGVAVVVTLINLVCRRWWRLLACAAPAIFLGMQLIPLYYPAVGASNVSAGRVYTAVLLNLRKDNKRPEAVVEYLRNQKADIVLLEEVTPTWEKRLRPLFGDFAHEVIQTRDHAFGIWLLSRLPLSDVRVLPGEEARVPYIYATIDMEGQALHFVGVHPVPPTGRTKAKDRNDRLAGAGDALRKEKGHRMILGDLNCTPWSPYFKRLLQSVDLLDSGKGRGFHPTWFREIPFVGLPIDHCLVSPSVVVVSRTVGSDVGSDHRPLMVEFSLPEPAPGTRRASSR